MAVCVSSASDTSRLRCSSSLNSRAFSMPIAAWSANDFNSAISFAENGPTKSRPTNIAPMPRPSQSSGAKIIDLVPIIRDPSRAPVGTPSPFRMSGK